jgi:hypothetical protein
MSLTLGLYLRENSAYVDASTLKVSSREITPYLTSVPLTIAIPNLEYFGV